jgi:transposase
MIPFAVTASLLAAVFAFVLFYRLRHLKPQTAGYASQRMCPSCGLITSRSNATCRECGKTFLS